MATDETIQSCQNQNFPYTCVIHCRKGGMAEESFGFFIGFGDEVILEIPPTAPMKIKMI